MGTKQAAYNGAGDIIGFYDTMDSPAPDDVTVIEITDEEWQAALTTQAHTVKRGKLVAPKPPSAEETLAADQLVLCQDIDGATDQAHAKLGSYSPGRLAEYAQAAAEATAYQDGGYAGKAPPSVACWAKASGLTMAKAADDILAHAAAWEAALGDIRAARLLGKAAVRGATTSAKARNAAAKAIEQIQAAGGG